MAKKLRTVQQALDKTRAVVGLEFAAVKALQFENGALVELVKALAAVLAAHGLADHPDVKAIVARVTAQLEGQAARIAATQGQA